MFSSSRLRDYRYSDLLSPTHKIAIFLELVSKFTNPTWPLCQNTHSAMFYVSPWLAIEIKLILAEMPCEVAGIWKRVTVSRLQNTKTESSWLCAAVLRASGLHWNGFTSLQCEEPGKPQSRKDETRTVGAVYPKQHFSTHNPCLSSECSQKQIRLAYVVRLNASGMRTSSCKSQKR